MTGDPRFQPGKLTDGTYRTVGESVRLGLSFDKAAAEYQTEFDAAFTRYRAAFIRALDASPPVRDHPLDQPHDPSADPRPAGQHSP